VNSAGRVASSRATDEGERKLIADIKRSGVHILHIFDAEGEEPEFSYSVGLWHTRNHPEVLIYGLKSDLRQSVINYIKNETKLGRSFRDGESAEGVLPGFTVYFQALPLDQYKEHLGWAEWFYDGTEFPAVQMLWPNTSGVYPWDDAADDYLRWVQPILTGLPPSAELKPKRRHH
jgi:hypothetical protein